MEGCFVVDRARAVVPPARFETLADPGQLVDDLGAVASGGVSQESGPGGCKAVVDWLAARARISWNTPRETFT